MLPRRTFLNALPAAAMFRAGGAHAEEQCLKHDNNGETCSAGIVIGNVQTARQRCKDWCWAACIETIFSLHGYKVYQEEVVKKVFGNEACRGAIGASLPEIISGIGGVWSNKGFSAAAYELPDTLLSQATKKPAPSYIKFLNAGDREVIAELNQGNPLIVGTRGQGALGHAMVLSAIKYEKYMGYPLWLTEFTVRDPWPDSPNRRLLTANEFAGSFFVVKVVVQAA